MKSIISIFSKIVCIVVVFGALACGGGSGGSSNSDSIVLRWNQIAIDASGIDHERSAAGEQFGPTRSSRAMAIVHLAMFEVVNSLEGNYRNLINVDPSAAPVTSSPTSFMQLAVAEAASETLRALYPTQAASFDAALSSDRVEIPELSEDERAAARTYGEAIAARVLAARTNDGSELSTDATDMSYSFSSAPGRWRKDPFTPAQIPLGTVWSSVRPFVLQSASQFRAPPPPALDSVEYAEAYAEVYRLGGDGVQTPTERTEEQTQIGIFWAYDGTPSLCAPPRMYNQIVRRIIELYGPSSELETARLLALANIAMADTAISIWEAKYFYDFWRPVTAIQEADLGSGPSGLGDGNPLTIGDPNFRPLGSPASNLFDNNFTPPFPTYPSGHGGFGAAVFEVLRQYYGTDELPFTFISDEFNGVTLGSDGQARPVVERSFERLSDAEEENGQSRIYLGIHFSFDKTSSLQQGRSVGHYVVQQLFAPRAVAQ